MRTVLVIAYYYPPLGLSGVQRTAKFTKYLQLYGWHPIVLTVGDVNYWAKDESQLAELEAAGVEIVRVPHRGFFGRMAKGDDVMKMPSELVRKFLSLLSQTIYQPDNKIGWMNDAVAMGQTIIEHNAIDAIFSTAPPFTDHLIATELKMRNRIPLVVDYRDAWVDNQFHFYATPFHRRHAQTLEEKVLRRSDGIIVTNRKLKEMMIRRYSFLNFNDITIIPQGFDPEDYEHALPVEQDHSKFVITYAGTFIEDITPKYFLRGLAQALAREPEMRGRVEARFIGIKREMLPKLVKKLKLETSVVTKGYLSHPETIRELRSSDVLWFTLGERPGSAHHTLGKIYEYIGARKPILALAPSDAHATGVVMDSGAGYHAPPHDVDKIAIMLIDLFHFWKQNTLKKASPEFTEQFNRRVITHELAKALESVQALV